MLIELIQGHFELQETAHNKYVLEYVKYSVSSILNDVKQTK